MACKGVLKDGIDWDKFRKDGKDKLLSRRWSWVRVPSGSPLHNPLSRNELGAFLFPIPITNSKGKFSSG